MGGTLSLTRESTLMKHVLKPLAVKKAKHAEKPYKLTDGEGLHLLVKSTGKYWRYNYRFEGK